MSGRLPVLKRIETLYARVEQMHSVALQQASARVRDAETAIAEQCLQMRNARASSGDALCKGSREDWFIAQAQCDLANRRRQSLENVRVELELVTSLARAEYSASRVKNGQINALVESIGAAELLVEGRRAQASADDRFLSRQRWTHVRHDPDMNLS